MLLDEVKTVVAESSFYPARFEYDGEKPYLCNQITRVELLITGK